MQIHLLYKYIFEALAIGAVSLSSSGLGIAIFCLVTFCVSFQRNRRNHKLKKKQDVLLDASK